MEKLVTNMDQHGRVLIPSEIRETLNIRPGDKVNLEVYENEVKIINANKIIDEMYAIFLSILNRIDEIYTDNPDYGYRYTQTIIGR
jgi:AbrB family looped-hinge helix DNA binding protein